MILSYDNTRPLYLIYKNIKTLFSFTNIYNSNFTQQIKLLVTLLQWFHVLVTLETYLYCFIQYCILLYWFITSCVFRKMKDSTLFHSLTHLFIIHNLLSCGIAKTWSEHVPSLHSIPWIPLHSTIWTSSLGMIKKFHPLLFLLPFISPFVTFPIMHYHLSICSSQLSFLSLIHVHDFIFHQYFPGPNFKAFQEICLPTFRGPSLCSV